MKKYICLLALPLILLAGVAFGGAKNVATTVTTTEHTLINVTVTPTTSFATSIFEEPGSFLNSMKSYDVFLVALVIDTLSPSTTCTGINGANGDTCIITTKLKSANGYYLYTLRTDTVTGFPDTLEFYYDARVPAEGSATTVLDSTGGAMNVGGYWAFGNLARPVPWFDSLYFAVVRRDTAVNSDDTATFDISAWIRLIEY